MSIWAIVPVKPFLRAKTRLTGVLHREDRAELSRRLLAHTLEVLTQVSAISHTLVISRDSSALALARRLNAQTIAEPSGSNLNTALRRATKVAQAYACEAVLIIATDLPLLAPEDVQALLKLRASTAGIVIAPDRHIQGTNALLCDPPGVIDYQFGADSFAGHLTQAKAANVHVYVCRRPNLGLDLDTPEDWALCRDQLRERYQINT